MADILTKKYYFLLFCEFLNSNRISNVTTQVEIIDFSLYYTINKQKLYIGQGLKGGVRDMSAELTRQCFSDSKFIILLGNDG